jgi:glutamine amidotransferase
VKKIAVLDHGMGNLRSVAKALEAAGANVKVTAGAREVESADALCVPGQGIFGRCVENLASTGNDQLVASWIGSGRPYLGICLGFQILVDHSEENDAKGLGIIPGRVKRLPAVVTVPHMGWNTVGDVYYYFDHSYAVYPEDESIVTGWCDHGDRFAAMVRTGPALAVQFHPEKSGRAGIELLKGWVA